MSRNLRIIQVVAGVICNPQQHILVALRPQHVLQGGLWEFPGGKIEPLETPLQALTRELKEEVGITVIKAKPFMRLNHTYPEREVALDVWWVEEFTGIPEGVEGQQIRWVTVETLGTLDLPAANKPIVTAIFRAIAM